jgi:hypothetical protein
MSHVQLSARQIFDPSTIWMLTGISVRLGQKIGLHRDGVQLGLSPFETEIRCRLWWMIGILDGRSAELCGCGNSTSAHMWDVKLPLNVNDSDLDPDMLEPPVEHSGSTEMMFCLSRCEVGVFLKKGSLNSPFDGYWAKLNSSATPIEEKDRAIDELERIFEHKFLRHCNPLIPLHALTTGIARVGVCKMRLLAHHPRQFEDHEAHLSQQELDSLFLNSLSIIQYDNLGHANPSLQRFLWHVRMHFQLDGFVYLLDALRKRTSGDLVDRAWLQVGDSYRFHTELTADTRNPLYAAIRNLTLAAYDSREADPSNQQLKTPDFIKNLRSMPRRSSKKSPVVPRNEDTPQIEYPPTINHENPPAHEQDPSPPSQLDPIDLSPMDWAYWDDLLKGAETGEPGIMALGAEGEAAFEFKM